jgi:hypothetical protein
MNETHEDSEGNNGSTVAAHTKLYQSINDFDSTINLDSPEINEWKKISLDTNENTMALQDIEKLVKINSPRHSGTDISLNIRRSLRVRKPLIRNRSPFLVKKQKQHRYSVEQLFRERKRENLRKSLLENIDRKLDLLKQNVNNTINTDQFKNFRKLYGMDEELEHVRINEVMNIYRIFIGNVFVLFSMF